MDKGIELIHHRNRILFRILWAFAITNFILELIYGTVDIYYNIVALIEMLMLIMISYLVWKKSMVKATMYLISLFIFIYMLSLIVFSPSIPAFIFMLLGLLLCSIYQDYSVIYLATGITIAMTIYFFTNYQEVIAYSLGSSGIVYFLLFEICFSGFLILSTRLTRELWLKAERSQEQLKNILESVDIASWSYNFKNNSLIVSPGIKSITGVSHQEFMEDSLCWKKMIHPYDSYKVAQQQGAALNGKTKVLDFRIILPNGEVCWIQNRISPVKNQSDKLLGLDGVIIDITEHKIAEERIKNMAYYDALTGLPNRLMFQDYFSNVLAREKYREQRMAIMFIDLDHFKAVNDALGHDKGDLLLKIVGKRLKASLRDSDMLARIGGDEFLALLEDVNEYEVSAAAQRMIESFSEPFIIEGQSFNIGTSIGISMYPHDGKDIFSLIKNADHAMYLAKDKGRNNYQMYNMRLATLSGKTC